MSPPIEPKGLPNCQSAVWINVIGNYLYLRFLLPGRRLWRSGDRLRHKYNRIPSFGPIVEKRRARRIALYRAM